MPAWLIVVGVVVLLLWLEGVFGVIADLLSGPSTARAGTGAPRAALDPEEPDRAGPLRRGVARGLAIRSRGPGRSLGELQLHADALVIVLPTGRVRIPRAEVVAAVRPRELFGQSVDDDLLEVEWRSAAGATDAVVCQVDDLDGWLAALAP